MHIGPNIFSRFSCNFEANASELQENLEEMFSLLVIIYSVDHEQMTVWNLSTKFPVSKGLINSSLVINVLTLTKWKC